MAKKKTANLLFSIGLMVLFAILILHSCGSRSVDLHHEKMKVEKAEEKAVSKQEQSEKTLVVRDTVFIEKKVEVKAETNEQRQKQSTEKRREYYENGTLKSETETLHSESETINILQQENALLREENTRIKSENARAKIVENEKIQALEKENKSFKDKQTNRRTYPWYWWVIGSVVVWELLKLLWRVYFKPVKSL